MKKPLLSFVFALACTMTIITGCSNKKSDNSSKSPSVNEKEIATIDDTTTYPLTIKHAFGETVLDKKPERVVAIAWGNQDVSLALDVVPVGMSKSNYGVSDGSGLLPWTADKLTSLGANTPVLFDDTDSLDFEAISDTNPDVILASYSGITAEDYELLSQIAPVIAYPKLAWQTLWRDQIKMDAKGMGMEKEGNDLVSELDTLIANKLSEYPQMVGKKAVFCYFNPADLGKFYVYLPSDPRASYLTDLGLEFPDSINKLAENNDVFTVELSAEHIDVLDDADIIVAYGNQALLHAMQEDALIGTVPAVKKGAVALIEDGTSLAASCTPSALSIPATIDEYLKLLGEAAKK